ncbi:hypothetical protein NliqN6_2009 [Naganishia liquefaciens]|uniref:Uncharacterized protein n=1 Tax=Naganishia liquefaciens TaxID=104408 RepID=A0A8H3TQY9_9TREE|nr:hypothetical protein NliqN6_2009 [Naganishia liquefaciens]
MPLLKRIEKRMSRKEKEDKLGITELKEKMKEMREDNGEEASSDSESDESSDSEDSEDGDSLSDEDSSSDDEEEDDQEDKDDGDGDEGEDEDGEDIEDAESQNEEDEPLPLESVLENPIYSLAEEDKSETLPEDDAASDTEATTPDGPLGCMLCPNKVFKNEKMVEVHLESKPHKRAAARFAKKIADPAFDRSGVTDPRDIALQIEEEIRAGSSSRVAPAQDAKASKRDKARNKKEDGSSEQKVQTQATEAGVAKPKKQRAWKEAKKEAKRRRMEAKETGNLPRKEAERQAKAISKNDLKPKEAVKVRKRDDGDEDEDVQTASKRKEGKAGKESKRRKV